MQQPVGFQMDGGNLAVSDPIAIFKQPLWFHMAWHSTLACSLAVSFAVAGWYARRALRGRKDPYVRSALLIAMLVGGVSAVLQPASGDYLAKHVFRTQPAKFAAMEGQFKTESYAPARIGGIPDVEDRETKYAIEIPGGLSFLATGNPADEVPGLDQIPRANWPNVGLTHAAFQLMVISSGLMLLLSVWFWWSFFRGRQKLLERHRLLWGLFLGMPLGFIGLEAGRFVSEVGRQPWIIQHVMRTADAVTPAEGVLPLFVTFVLLYVVLSLTVIVLLRKLASAKIDDGPSKT
jgi:cytochrome d ubiquinol oxidase subunit I